MVAYRDAVDNLHGMLVAGQLSLGESAEKAFFERFHDIVGMPGK